MPMSLQQFGATIKAKHPDYADMADEDVATKVLTKYPQYGDMVGPSTSVPQPAGLQGPDSGQSAAPSTVQSRAFGDNPVSNTLNVVGQHLKNFVAGPYHAFTDAPRNPQEQQIKGTTPDTGLLGNAVGQFGLGAARMLAQPTREAIQRGNSATNLNDKMNAYEDAVPVVGPWARNISNDAESKGALPAMAGLATDIFAPTAASKALGMVKPLAKAAAVADGKNMIRPGVNDISFGKDPVPAMLSQPGGILSTSKAGLLAKTQRNLQNVGQQIGSEIKNAPANPMNISSAVVDPLNQALSSAAKSNETGLYSRLKDVRQAYTNNLEHDPQTDSIYSQGPKPLNVMTPAQAWDLKQQVGKDTRWTDSAFDNDVNATRGSIYGGIRNELVNQLPQLQGLFKQYGDLKAATNALQRRIPIEDRNNPVSLSDTVAGVGGMAAGGIGPAIGLVAAKKALGSMAFRTPVTQGLWNYASRPPAQFRAPLPYPGIFGSSSSDK